MKHYLVVICSSLFLFGCTSTPTTLSVGGVKTDLLLATDDSTYDEFFKLADNLEGIENYDSDLENEIAQVCGVPRPTDEKMLEGVSVPAIALSFVIEPLIQIFLDRVEQRIAEELEAYTAAYGAGITSDKVYSEVSSQDMGIKCFRFIRVIETDENANKLAMDLIGQFNLTEDHGALQVRPLRLYYGAAAAKGDTFGLAISMKTDSAWLDGKRPTKQEVFSHTLINEKRKLSENTLRYYFKKNEIDDGWDQVAIYPIIPWSKSDGEGGNARFTLTVAEVGQAPKYLEHFAEIFSAKKDELGGLLNQAAASALGVD